MTLKRRDRVLATINGAPVEGNVYIIHMDGTVTVDVHVGPWMGKYVRLPWDCWTPVDLGKIKEAFARDRGREDDITARIKGTAEAVG